MFLGFNLKQGPTAKLEVRQAIAMALDRKAMVQTLRQGMAEEAVSMVPRTVFGASTNLKAYDYNVAEAKALLQKAGVTTPLKIKLNTYENAETKQIASAIQAQLKEIGIDVEVIVSEFSAYQKEVSKPDHDMWISSWGTVTMDADYTFYALLHSGQHEADNRSFYSNQNVDQWLTEARATTDPQVRQALYQKVQEQVQADLPYITLYYPLSNYAKNKRLQGEVYPFAMINLDLRKAEIK
jgi:peptide/nickel transport system substrate-binding protein